MSILGKEWVLKYERKAGESLWAALLSTRQIKDPGSFFASAALSDLHDPFLFPDMQKAATRIQEAIHARERIVIYGDYDVDGTSGSAILIHTLRFLGAEVSYRIPHRMQDGYGLHMKYIDELAEQKTQVLITVDCGISCPNEVAAAQEKGMDVIITDHHTVPKNPPKAFATLHPQLAENYPNKNLSGSGVAFKLASALLIASKNEDMIPMLTDLASLGTVADCVPLTGENRSIVKLGLEQMKRTKWDGLRAILESAGSWGRQDFTCHTIGYQIGPRLNASGRIDHPYWALQTLISDGQTARKKSKKLEELNQKRQKISQKMLEEADAAVDTSKPILIAEDESWSSGIVGLIAGRLQEKYDKPTFIIEDRGDSLVGSARSLPGFHLVDALREAHDLLENYGGHEQAAGFHLKKENYEKFKEILHTYAEEFFKKNPIKPRIQVDLKLLPGEASLEHCQKIASFAPFGTDNPIPTFLLENTEIVDSRPVGRNEEHLKFTAKFGDDYIDGIAFHFKEHEAKFLLSSKLLVRLEKNEWNGITNPQLFLVDFA